MESTEIDGRKKGEKEGREESRQAGKHGETRDILSFEALALKILGPRDSKSPSHPTVTNRAESRRQVSKDSFIASINASNTSTILLFYSIEWS